MSILVLDAGALIALERGSRGAWGLIDAARRFGDAVQVPACALAQVWSGHASQARLHQALKRCRTVPFDDAMARIAGRLRALSGVNDIADASAVATAALATSLTAVVIATSDWGDISRLLEAAGAIPNLVRNSIRIHAV